MALSQNGPADGPSGRPYNAHPAARCSLPPAALNAPSASGAAELGARAEVVIDPHGVKESVSFNECDAPVADAVGYFDITQHHPRGTAPDREPVERRYFWRGSLESQAILTARAVGSAVT